MKYIIPDFKMNCGRHCFYSSLNNTAQYENMGLNEAEIFVVCDGFGIEYDKSTESVDIKSYDDLLVEFSNRVSAGAHLYKNDGSSDIIEDITASILCNRPVTVLIRNLYLTYNTTYIESKNYFHFVMLYGVDTDSQCFNICDSFMLNRAGNASVYTGLIPFDSIKNGVKAYTWFDFEQKKHVSKEYLYTLFMERFERFLSYSGDKLYGYNSIKAYIENMEQLESADQTRFEDMCTDAIYKIKFNFMHIIDYVIEITHSSLSLDGQASEGLINDLQSTKKEWGKFFINIFKIAYSGDRSKVSRIVQMGRSMYTRQEEAFLNVTNTAGAQDKPIGG